MITKSNTKNIEQVERKFITHDGSGFMPSSCCNCFHNRKKVTFIPDGVDLKDISYEKKILVLDLDETLVHCSFCPMDHYDYCISIIIEGVPYEVYVQKRPGVCEFLEEVQKKFIVVIFTASLSHYANPIIDLLCPNLPESQRLFRESCTLYDGLYVKDLGIFQKELSNIIIVDNNPCSFMFHQNNAVLSETWEGDRNDGELLNYILPLLEECIDAEDVRNILSQKMKS